MCLESFGAALASHDAFEQSLLTQQLAGELLDQAALFGRTLLGGELLCIVTVCVERSEVILQVNVGLGELVVAFALQERDLLEDGRVLASLSGIYLALNTRQAGQMQRVVLILSLGPLFEGVRWRWRRWWRWHGCVFVMLTAGSYLLIWICHLGFKVVLAQIHPADNGSQLSKTDLEL